MLWAPFFPVYRIWIRPYCNKFDCQKLLKFIIYFTRSAMITAEYFLKPENKRHIFLWEKVGERKENRPGLPAFLPPLRIPSKRNGGRVGLSRSLAALEFQHHISSVFYYATSHIIPTKIERHKGSFLLVIRQFFWGNLMHRKLPRIFWGRVGVCSGTKMHFSWGGNGQKHCYWNEENPALSRGMISCLFASTHFLTPGICGAASASGGGRWWKGGGETYLPQSAALSHIYRVR